MTYNAIAPHTITSSSIRAWLPDVHGSAILCFRRSAVDRARGQYQVLLAMGKAITESRSPLGIESGHEASCFRTSGAARLLASLMFLRSNCPVLMAIRIPGRYLKERAKNHCTEKDPFFARYLRRVWLVMFPCYGHQCHRRHTAASQTMGRTPVKTRISVFGSKPVQMTCKKRE
jgi:hypothetical protein